jgi:hypothetical protein
MRPILLCVALALPIAGCYTRPQAPATVPSVERASERATGPAGRTGTVWIELGGAKTIGMETEWDDGTPVDRGEEGRRDAFDGTLGVVAGPDVELSVGITHHRLAIADIRQYSTTATGRVRSYLTR